MSSKAASDLLETGRPFHVVGRAQNLFGWNSQPQNWDLSLLEISCGQSALASARMANDLGRSTDDSSHLYISLVQRFRVKSTIQNFDAADGNFWKLPSVREGACSNSMTT